MARNQITFETLDAILGAADLYIAQPDDGYDDDSDAVSVRPAYRGRGYRPEGFGLVFRDMVLLYAIMAAAGRVAAEQELDEDHENERLDALAFARAVETDNMGHGVIAWFPDWEVTGLPEHLTNQH